MSETLRKAKLFFEACETGKGWEGCKEFCHPDATFSAQAEVLSNVNSLEIYIDWVKGQLIAIPDGHYEMRFFAVDEERDFAAAYAVFHGTQTGPGGPCEPTGKSFSADYVYAMQFKDGRIQHLTKIWNDTISLKQLGWL